MMLHYGPIRAMPALQDRRPTVQEAQWRRNWRRLRERLEQPDPILRCGRLTPREHQVLAGFASGENGSRIAARLGISEYTVRNHVEHLREKLGARTIAQAVARGYESGQLP